MTRMRAAVRFSPARRTIVSASARSAAAAPFPVGRRCPDGQGSRILIHNN